MTFRFVFILIIALSIVLGLKQDSKLNDVLKKHEKLVGQEHKGKLEMIKQTGFYDLSGQAEIKFVSYIYNDAIRVEYYYDENEPAVTVYSPDSSWKTTPWDTKSVVSLTEVEENKYEVWAQLTGVLANRTNLNYKFIYNEEESQKSNSFVLSATMADQVTKINAYVNPSTYMINKTERIEWTRGAELKRVVEYGNYVDVSGVMIPKKISEKKSEKVAITHKVNDIEVNLKYKRKLFKKP